MKCSGNGPEMFVFDLLMTRGEYLSFIWIYPLVIFREQIHMDIVDNSKLDLNSSE